MVPHPIKRPYIPIDRRKARRFHFLHGQCNPHGKMQSAVVTSMRQMEEGTGSMGPMHGQINLGCMWVRGLLSAPGV